MTAASPVLSACASACVVCVVCWNRVPQSRRVAARGKVTTTSCHGVCCTRVPQCRDDPAFELIWFRLHEYAQERPATHAQSYNAPQTNGLSRTVQRYGLVTCYMPVKRCTVP